MKHPGISLLLLVACFGLGAMVEPRLGELPIYDRHSGTPIETLLGDGSKLFANHFYSKADAYFHSGFYPSIFDDRTAFQKQHIATDAGAAEDRHAGEEGDFLGQPRDWLEKFGRSFFPSEHTHLDHGGADGHEDHESHSEAREILPWLRLTAELDPHKPDVYTVGAFWLRTQLGKVAEAEEFLRDGLRANPGSYAILFELGRIAAENRKDPRKARNLWEKALEEWEKQNKSKEEPDDFLLSQICLHLGLLEREAGDYPKAIGYFERVKAISPNPAEVQKRIDELRAEAKAGSKPQ